MKSLIIVPAYNESGNIERVVDELIAKYPQYDYVIVNDGSADDTADICRARGYNLLDLPVNLGLAGAFQTGMKYAYQHGYKTAVQFDADGQHRAEYISVLLEKLQEGYHIVIGSRFATIKKPFALRMMGSDLISFAIHLTTGKRVKDPTSGMRMYDRVMIEQFASHINHAPEPDTLSYLLKKGAKIAEVQVEMDERIIGEIYLNFSRSIFYMLSMGISIVLVQPFRAHTKLSPAQATETEVLR